MKLRGSEDFCVGYADLEGSRDGQCDAQSREGSRALGDEDRLNLGAQLAAVQPGLLG